MPCASWPGFDKLDCVAHRATATGGRASPGKEGTDMAGENSGKKPEKPGGAGLEKDPPKSAEAEPRSKRMAYICWNDGASNFVEPGWEWFTCWRCGALVYTA